MTKHEDALDASAAQGANIRTAAERYMLAVKRLGEESGYNRLTFFEAPIGKMPTDEMAAEAAARWVELNNSGQALLAALSPVEQSPAEVFAKWLDAGPKLAKAAGCYVGIKVSTALAAEGSAE